MQPGAVGHFPASWKTLRREEEGEEEEEEEEEEENDAKGSLRF